MTIKEVFLNQEGKEMMARVLPPGPSDYVLGHSTPEGADPYDEWMVIQNPDTVNVLRITIEKGGKTKEKWRTLQGQEINDAGLTRIRDTNRLHHIVWEPSKPF